MNGDELIEDLRWVSAPSPGGPWPALLAAVAVLAGLAVFAWWWRRRQGASRPAAPSLPAHVIALEELARLRASMTAENHLAFVIEVSRILRAYIQGRFGLRAPHRSTEEFLMEAAESPQLTADQQDVLADFLRQCDLVKFAQRTVALDRMAELLDTATRFVRETIPSTPPAGASTPASTP